MIIVKSVILCVSIAVYAFDGLRNFHGQQSKIWGILCDLIQNANKILGVKLSSVTGCCGYLLTV